MDIISTKLLAGILFSSFKKSDGVESLLAQYQFDCQRIAKDLLKDAAR